MKQSWEAIHGHPEPDQENTTELLATNAYRTSTELSTGASAPGEVPTGLDQSPSSSVETAHVSTIERDQPTGVTAKAGSDKDFCLAASDLEDDVLQFLVARAESIYNEIS